MVPKDTQNTSPMSHGSYRFVVFYLCVVFRKQPDVAGLPAKCHLNDAA